MKKLFLPLLALSLVAAGCGTTDVHHAQEPAPSDTQEQTGKSPKPTLTPTATPTPTPTPTEKGYAEVGEPAEQGGVQMTVHSAANSPTVSLNQTNYRSGSGYETYTEVPAQTGGHYVIVTTTVKNNGKESMDLTCGWPIEVGLFDAEDRLFDPIDSLYEMKDNPQCNASLQPGFESQMSYGFLVPDGAKVLALAFRDTETEPSAEPGIVRLDLP